MSEFLKIVEAPTASVKQLSGKNSAGKAILSVVAKVRYKIENGRCVSPAYDDLLEEPKFSDDDSFLEAEADVFPDKGMTDFLIRGSVFGGGRSQVDAGVSIGGRRVEWRVFGPRFVQVDELGKLQFSTPESFEKVELGFRNAYGGIAEHAAKEAHPWHAAFPKYSIPDSELPDYSTPFSYPRNPVGKGYVVGKGPEAAAGVELPNIEWLDNLLTPDRLICPDILSWPAMPLPAPVGLLSYEWFPRSGYCNMIRPYHDTFVEFDEVKRGYAGREVVSPRDDSPESGHRFACAASGPFQLAFLRGGESISSWEIGGVGKKIDLILPAAPLIWTDGRQGKLQETEVAIDSITLDADKDEVVVVWRGRAEALRAYLPDELTKMPLKVQFA